MTFNPDAPLDPSRVSDRRGLGGGGLVVGGGGIGVLLLVVSLLLGVNPLESGLISTDVGQPSRSLEECRTGADANARTDCRAVGFVGSLDKYWSAELARQGIAYRPAQTVLFSGGVQAACGFASTAAGPFYCPSDQTIYIDLTFFDQLRTEFGARGGPLAEGYVIAHEYGHHIQNLTHRLSGVADQGPQSSSVRTELGADCLAGLWTRHASATGYLQTPTDAEVGQALDAAAAVGDDRIQRQTAGRVSPEKWTHGSSAQRQQAFNTGYRGGSLSSCP